VTTATRPKMVYHCARCKRRLKRYVYSKTTRYRYCYPGEGCGK
jgi:hypothetical protein